MTPWRNLHGKHQLVTLQLPGRRPMNILCLREKDKQGVEAFYVLAECEGRALYWRSLVRDNSIRRLRDEFLKNITAVEDVDQIDVEMIFLCTAEVSKAEARTNPNAAF